MRRAALLLSLAGLLAATAARAADLRDTATRAQAQWKSAGAVVAGLPTRFLYEDDTISVRVPALPPGRCTSVALIGGRGMSFHARVAGNGDDDDEEDLGRSMSVGGILEIVRCAPSPPIDRVVVTSDGGRGAVEVVVARSRVPPPPLRTVFPERSGGPLPPSPDPGPLPPLPPPGKRAEVAEARARADGAAIGARESFDAAADGTGGSNLDLEPGCHRIELFGPDPRATHPQVRSRFRLDVDAELRDEDEDTLLARDRTDSPDARLETCVGGPRLTNLVFVGAPPNTKVLVTHASWAIPEKLPRVWELSTRARMAAALLARHLPPPKEDPVVLAQGPSSLTPLFVPLEAGACYVAVAAIAHGAPHGLGLRAIVEGSESLDERGTNDDSGAVAFCARDADHARIEVDARARGTQVVWALAVYRVQTRAWEGVR